MRLRAELRRGWALVAVVAIVSGVFGGAVAGAAAGARRTDSVAVRQHEASNQPDLFLPMFEGGPVDPVDPAHVRAVEEADAVIEVHEFRVEGDLALIGSPDARLEQTHAIPRMLEGRLPREADEVMVNEPAHSRLGLSTGDVVEIRFAPPGATTETGAFSFLPGREPDRRAPAVTKTFQVTGVAVSSGDLVAAAEPAAVVSRAFLAQNPQIPTDSYLMVWLRSGEVGVSAFRRQLADRTGGAIGFVIEARIDREQLQHSFHLQAVALWLLAAAIAVTTILVLGQTIARQVLLSSQEFPILSALGASRRQLTALAAARPVIGGIAGAFIALGVAYISSSLTPFGLAALAEPQPGLRFDALSMLAGGLAVAVVTSLLAIGPAVAAARAVRTDRADNAPPRRSRVAALLAAVWSRPTGAVGARMALESGRGASAAPVRSTFGGVILAMSALVAALTVGASLDRLMGTPGLYGWNWDAMVHSAREGVPPDVSGIEGISASAPVLQFVPLAIDEGSQVGMAIEEGSGDITPSLLEGRAPRGLDELTLGRTVMNKAGLELGDVVQASIDGASVTRAMRVVGVSVFPRVDDSVTAGEGAFLTMDAVRSILPDAPAPTTVLVRFAAGSEGSALAEVRADDLLRVELPSPPSSVVDFGRVSTMPLIFAILVGALAAGTLAHSAATTIRRRRRDFAILRCLGFVGGQVRAAVAWQATITVALSVAVSVPAGIATGRWMWRLMAGSAGLIAQPAVPWVGLAVVLPASLLLANIVSSVPGRAAARTQPATVLRVG